jgi:hypothetical protein
MTADEIRALPGRISQSQIACLVAKHLMPAEIARAFERKRRGRGGRTVKFGLGRSADIVAEQVGVSPVTICRAKAIMERDPKLFEQVAERKVSLWKAYQKVNKRTYNTRSKKTKKGWTVKGAISRINYAVEMELARYQRLGNDRSQYVAIGQWLEERGKRWNNVRGESMESCGVVHVNGDAR